MKVKFETFYSAVILEEFSKEIKADEKIASLIRMSQQAN